MDKERDNTWLQLAICPSVLKDGGKCVGGDEEKCPYAHPPPSVLKFALGNGYVVSCHDFVFSHSSGSGGGSGGNSAKRGCTRFNCKYFHPPMYLRLQVINAGKNNKRLLNKMLQRRPSQQQVGLAAAAAAAAYWAQPVAATAAATALPSSQAVTSTPFLPFSYANSFCLTPVNAIRMQGEIQMSTPRRA